MHDDAGDREVRGNRVKGSFAQDGLLLCALVVGRRSGSAVWAAEGCWPQLRRRVGAQCGHIAELLARCRDRCPVLRVCATILPPATQRSPICQPTEPSLRRD